MNAENSDIYGADVVLGDLSYKIMAAVFEVHNVLGSGFLESVYEKALLRELHLNGLKSEAQKPLRVGYKGEEVGTYFPDIIVNDAIIIELKATEKLSPAHEAQVLNYLRATGLRLGLLVNFGKPRVEYKRLVR